MFHFSTLPSLSLYIHVPWCVRKCPYCDFNSHALRDPLPEPAYIDALIADLEQDLPHVWGRNVETVFIGGGTPSLLSPEAIDRLLGAVRARLTLNPAAEITLEANPGTVDQARFRGYREAGVNRLSIGIQSFQPELLQAIGRIHDDVEALAAIEAAQAAGFEAINLDLMHGLPGQTPDQARQDLLTAMALQPQHLSWYELTIEPNTWFYRHPPQRPDEASLGEIQAAGGILLGEGGYRRYEVSAWARDDRRCRHNLNYWEFGDYLGIGAGAHSKVTDANRQRITRQSKLRHPRAYLEHAHHEQRIATDKVLSASDTVLEFVMNALRLDSGFSEALFTRTTGLPFSITQDQITAALEAEMLEEMNGTIRTTARGRQYLDELLQLWITVENDARNRSG